MNTIIKGLHDYFEKCPLMANGKLNVDFLPEAGCEYSIDVDPTEEVIQWYLRGAAKCQYVFAIRTLSTYGQEVLQQLDNSGYFEQLAAWLREQKRKGNFPKLPDGYTPIDIIALSPAYLFETDIETAKYQIQCRLVYKRKGDK